MRKVIGIVLMLAVATMMTPVSGSATLFDETNGGRAAWEAAVSYVYTDVTLPATNLAAWASYSLPGAGQFFNLDQGLTYPGSGNFYYTAGAGTLDISFYPQPAGVSNFGLEVDPILGSGTFRITAYLGPGGGQGSITNTWNSTSAPFFYGWTALPVYSLSIVSLSTAFGIGDMVEGGVGTSHAPVPEPATMILLGIGLVGIVGIRRRIEK